MILLLLLTQAFLSAAERANQTPFKKVTSACPQSWTAVLSEEPPPPPQDVHVNKWLLTWTPPTAETDLTYTVQSGSHSAGWIDVPHWTDVPACVRTPSTSCDVALKAAENEHGCVLLRVHTERRGLKSSPVQACSSHGDSCTPEVSLSARPGSLTVHLRRNHSLAQKHAAIAKHRVHYSREGETAQLSEDSSSSLTLRQLEAGQRYCVQVEYIYHGLSVGPPSCSLCELLPHSGAEVKPGVIVVVCILLLLLMTVTAYVFIFQQRRIKEWLRPPYTIPEEFYCKPHFPKATLSSAQERYDIIDCVTQEEQSMRSDSHVLHKAVTSRRLT